MLNQEETQLLKKRLTLHERKCNYPYFDQYGNITIGVGYNLTARGLPDSWINKQLDDDIKYFYSQLMNTFDWFKELSPIRQIALVDMAFMGWQHFITFVHMLDALAQGDYKRASEEMLKSKWAEQVGNRAKELAHMIETGTMES